MARPSFPGELETARRMDRKSEADVHEPDREEEHESRIICPVCGMECLQRRCKVVCESDQCRGRVVLNCWSSDGGEVP